MNIHIQLLALLCGHFLGDFVFQTDRLAELKSNQKKWMIFHVLLVSLTTWILLGNLSAWWIAGIIFIFHWLIDAVKIMFIKIYSTDANKSLTEDENSGISDKSINNKQKEDGQKFIWFIIDQFLHILIIISLCHYLIIWNVEELQQNTWEVLLGAKYGKGLLLLTGLAIVTSGLGIVLKFQMAEFIVELDEKVIQGLPKGGKTIGILERLLIFMFVLAGKPEGAGFVIAAKSVFRIGDLTNKEAKDHAEYIMIGSLRSFTYALAIAFVIKWLITKV